MQDVCIPFWREDGTEDMMLKDTDICSTDPNDPSYCAIPADIKIDRSKAVTMQHLEAIGTTEWGWQAIPPAPAEKTSTTTSSSPTTISPTASTTAGCYTRILSSGRGGRRRRRRRR